MTEQTQDYEFTKDGKFVLLTRGQLEALPKAKAWYEEQRADELEAHKNAGKHPLELEAKLEAALSGSKSYRLFNEATGRWDKFDFPPTEKMTLLRALTARLAGLQGDIATALFGGFSIPVQHIADVLSGLPGASYIQGILEELEKKILLKVKNSWMQYDPLAVVGGIIAGGILLMGMVFKAA